jgi:hypothetical protein
VSVASHPNLELLNGLYQLSDVDITDITDSDQQILMVLSDDSTESIRVLV